MTAARVMPCRGGGARSTTRPSEPGDRHETNWHARKDSNLRRLITRFWKPALLPLSYARVAGEIGIEPMASCASDRRSTHAELLAECEVLSGPGRSRTDRLRMCKCGALPN